MRDEFDSRRWRLYEQLAGIPQALYHRTELRGQRVVGLWTPPSASRDYIPQGSRLLCSGQCAEMSLDHTLEAFVHAVSAGAHLVAEPLAQKIRKSLPGWRKRSHERAARALATHYAALGDEGSLLALRRDCEPLLGKSPSLDPEAISKEIESGALDGNGVRQLLRNNRPRLLLNPQLHLLAHQSLLETDPEAAARALNRFLRTQGRAQVVPNAVPFSLQSVVMKHEKPVNGGPLVSVLVSAYNAANTIQYALRSLLNQTYQNIEILVCDDHSSDSTLSVLRSEFSAHPKIEVVRSVCNQGTYNIRNALLSRARGEFIAVHDADDFALPTRIEFQMRQLRESGASASIANLLRVTPEGRVQFFRDGNASRMAIVTLMARKSLFSRMGSYRSALFGADFEYLERLKAHLGSSAIARVRSPQLLSLWSPGSVTQTLHAQSLASGFRSPARRLYSDLIYRQRVLGKAQLSDRAIDEQLKASANWKAPSEVVPC